MPSDDESRVVDGIVAAISERTLGAGTKLGEVTLGEIYSCSRADVRRALVKLSSRGFVELRKHRGAFVAAPSPKEARDVFQARRAIERTLVRNAVLSATAAHIERLRRHNADELGAREKQDRAAVIGLSGEFHMLLGEAGDNHVLMGYLRELVTRSSLIIGLYSPAREPACEIDEHGLIIAAMERRDIDGTLALVDTHLRHIEASVRLETEEARRGDIREILAVRSPG